MNKTEKLAHDWLAKQGYTNIVFHSNSTPDFTTDTEPFEVKKLDSHTITFTHKQFGELQRLTGVKILVFNGEANPIANIPFAEINDNRQEWHDIRIRQTPPRTHPIKTITVSPSTYDKFMSYQEYSESREGILLKLMDMADKYKRRTTGQGRGSISTTPTTKR